MQCGHSERYCFCRSDLLEKVLSFYGYIKIFAASSQHPIPFVLTICDLLWALLARYNSFYHYWIHNKSISTTSSGCILEGKEAVNGWTSGVNSNSFKKIYLYVWSRTWTLPVINSGEWRIPSSWVAVPFSVHIDHMKSNHIDIFIFRSEYLDWREESSSEGE